MNVNELERDLDISHKDFSLLRLPETVAVHALLRLMEMALQREGNLSDFVAGLNYALHWVQTGCPEESRVTHEVLSTHFQDAIDLLKWGVDYAKLKVRFIAHHRGFVRCEIDTARKTVLFEPVQSLHIYADVPEAEEKLFHAQQQSTISALLTILREFMLHTSWSRETGFFFDPSVIRGSSAFPQVRQWIDSIVVPELPDDLEIGQRSPTSSSYTLGDLRQFFATVYVLSFCLQKFAQFSTLDGPSPLTAASIVFPTAEMLTRLEMTTWLKRDIITAIAEDMTTRVDAPGLIQAYPFVKTKDDHMFLCAAMFGSSNIHKMAASALTRMGKHGAKSYNNSSQLIERQCVTRIRRELERYGYHVAQEPKIAGKTPDLLVWDDRTTSILVMDFKNYLPVVDGKSYVDRRGDLQKGIRQVSKYVELLRAAPADLGAIIGRDRSGCKVYGILLTRFPMTVPHVHDPNVLVLDWARLESLLEQVPRRTHTGAWSVTRPSRRYSTLELARKAPRRCVADLERLLARVPKPILEDLDPREVKVGEWTYILRGSA